MKNKKLARSRALAAKLAFATLNILKDNGGELPSNEVMKLVEKNVALDNWAQERYEKSGYIRWQSILHFYSIDLVKTGYLIKRKGIWFLTSEGEDALKLGEIEMFKSAVEGYKKWREENPKEKKTLVNGDNDVEEDDESLTLTLDQIDSLAISTIKNHIQSKNPYEFQYLAAALLRGMGYYTPFVSPRGKDGGVDVIAYRDPLGTVAPRIKVQIKHKESSTSVQDLRQLMGLLQKDGDVGIFISSGGFTPDAKTTARTSHVHVELIDLDRFINLWLEFYDKLSDEDKTLLPLLPFYFYTPDK